MARRRKRNRSVQPVASGAVSTRYGMTKEDVGDFLEKNKDLTGANDGGKAEGEPRGGGGKSTKEEDLDDIHKIALEEYQRGFDKDRKNQERAYEALRFLAEEGQWEDAARRDRLSEGRPILTANKCPQFVRQVTGDLRQSRPAIKVVPVDDAASQETAEKVLPGLIRYIEQRSYAQGVYFSTADSTAACGIGHWRVTTEYASNTTFNQEIRIDPVEDGVAVVWDADAILIDRSDALYCFVPVDMSKKKFEKKYPDASASSLTTVPAYYQSWFTDDYVRVAEYWRKKPMKRKIASFPDGTIQDVTNAKPEVMADVQAVSGVTYDERDGFQVQRFVITATEIIEGPEDWDGPDIPIIPYIGEEVKFGREIWRHGVVQPLMDVQRAYNYAFSTEVEVIALQPKSPFIGTRINFEKNPDEWETANSRNWSYLEFQPDPINHGAPPARSPPPIGSSGLNELMQTTTADMSAVTGIYPSSLGQQSNESSGKAIIARQREGDTGTYVYISNFGCAVRRTGQIIVNLAPYVYDAQRIIRIAGEDGKIDKLEINKEEIDPNGDGIATRILHDLTVGAYEVSIEMGPSYNTKREEAREGMADMIQTLGPQGATLFIDLFAKQQDWPLADKIAKRAHMLLPPNIQQQEAVESGEPPPPPQPPPPPTPEQQAQMAEAEAKAAEFKDQQERGRAEFALQGRQHELEVEKLNFEREKFNTQMRKDLETLRNTHAEKMAGHAVTAQDTQMGADAKFTAIEDALEMLRKAVLEIAKQLETDKQKDAAEPKPEPAAPPAPPDHTPTFLDIIGKLANKPTPKGVKRTTNGMELVYDQPPEGTPTQ